MSLSYGSRTEHVALHGARNRTKARDNALNAIPRIGNDEAAGGGAQRSCAGAIEDRPAAGSSVIPDEALSTRPGRRIERGGANSGACGHSRREFRTGNWRGRHGDDSAEISSRVTGSVENPRLIEGHRVRRCGAIFWSRKPCIKAERKESAASPRELAGEARQCDALVILGLAHPDRTADMAAIKSKNPSPVAIRSFINFIAGTASFSGFIEFCPFLFWDG